MSEINITDYHFREGDELINIITQINVKVIRTWTDYIIVQETISNKVYTVSRDLDTITEYKKT